MPLTSCRLWDKTADHKSKHYSQTVVMRQYIGSILVQCHLPTDINIIRSCHQEYGDHDSPVLHSFVHWQSEAWLILFSCEGIGVLLTHWWTFASIYHFIWRSPTSLSTYCHLSFPMLMWSLTKMNTQKCGNLENTRIMTSSHVQSLYFRTCLNNVNVS